MVRQLISNKSEQSCIFTIDVPYISLCRIRSILFFDKSETELSKHVLEVKCLITYVLIYKYNNQHKK